MNSADLLRLLEEGDIARKAYSDESKVPVDKLIEMENSGRPYIVTDPVPRPITQTANPITGNVYMSSGSPMMTDTGKQVGQGISGRPDPRSRKLIYEALMNDLRENKGK